MKLRSLAAAAAMSVAVSLSTTALAYADASSKCFVNTQSGRETCLLYYRGELAAIWTQGIGIRFLY